MVMLCEEIKKENVNLLNEDYIFEYKFDGERALIYIQDNRISQIINRRGLNILKQFPEFLDLRFDFEKGIIDSEIIVVANGKEKGDFNEGLAFRSHLQNEKEIDKRAKILRAKIIGFDLLEFNGENLRNKPLVWRKKLLKENLNDSDLIELSKVYNNFNELWIIVERDSLEGVIAKHLNTAYEEVRSKFWLKIKNWKEIVIEFDDYEIAKSEKNPYYKGIVLKNSEGLRCSCLGKKSDVVKEILAREGKIKVNCQFLETTKEGKQRFITFKEVVKC